MKTIKWLNEHWWYRLIKVAYLLLFVLAGIIAIWINLDSVGNYQTDYSVVCNYGNKGSFLAAKDKEIYIPTYYDYTNSLANLPDYVNTKIQETCAISQAERVAKMDRIANNTDDGKKLFDLTETKVNVVTYWTAILWSILSVMVIAIIAELIRRVFYYIVLGSVRPKKQ